MPDNFRGNSVSRRRQVGAEMNNFLRVLALILVCALATTAEAASRFWVGGAGTWDNVTTTHWAATSNGAGGASVPVTADQVTFDGSSGGGTVTVDASINNISLNFLNIDSFTGTLDFATSNNNITLSLLSANGSATKTLNMGSGTWTITGGNTVWNMTSAANLTLNASTSTLVFSGSGTNRNATFGGKTYSSVTISSSAAGALGPSFAFGSLTAATLNLTAPVRVSLSGGSTVTLTNAFNWNGSSATNLVIFEMNSNGASTVTISIASGTATATWAVFEGITCSGGATFSATSSFGYNTSGITITGPSGGGSSGRIIGGSLLKRDLDPASNDNSPAWVDVAA